MEEKAADVLTFEQSTVLFTHSVRVPRFRFGLDFCFQWVCTASKVGSRCSEQGAQLKSFIALSQKWHTTSRVETPCSSFEWDDHEARSEIARGLGKILKGSLSSQHQLMQCSKPMVLI